MTINNNQKQEPNLSALPRNTAVPLYQLIQDSIIQKIRSGEWGKGEKVPSENTLVEDLGVSRMTINRALRELTQRGYLERVHGVGTFVAEPPRHASLIEIQDIADEIRAQGKNHHADIWHIQAEQAHGDVAERMEVKPGTEVFHIVMLHFQNDVPIQLEERWVNPSMAPEFLTADFSATTPTQYLINLYRPDEMEHIVRAILPDEEMQEMLAIPSTEPCLRLSRRTWKNGAVVTLADFTYPSTRYDLGARYATNN
ncbi:histidine utilization repressor [Porticoccaceae bacterium LTM1]|nr:histidine utilization repressor [Porticoccaceae bacterium LTM1]